MVLGLNPLNLLLSQQLLALLFLLLLKLAHLLFLPILLL